MPGESRTNFFDRWFLGAVGLIALLIGAGILSVQSIWRLSENAEWVAHTHKVLAAESATEGHLREAEAQQRSYVIVGSDEALADFDRALHEIRQGIDRIKSLTSDNLHQQARIPKIETEIDALIIRWKQTIDVRREQGFDAARQIVAAGESRGMIAELARRFDEMEEEEGRLLAERSEDRASAFRSAILTGLISSITAIVGVAAFTLLLRRHLHARAAAAMIVAEQHERLRTTLASIGDGVITTDREGRVTGINPVAESLTDWSLADAVGQPLESVFRIVNETSR